MKRLGSVVRNINVYAMSQQPNATMPGNMRLCGPDTAGEIKRRLTLAGSVAPTVEAARPFEVPCLALAMRDCEVLPLAGALLRFWAFGMAQTRPLQSHSAGLLPRGNPQKRDQRSACRGAGAPPYPVPVSSVPRVPRPFAGISHQRPYLDQPELSQVV